MPKTVKRKKDYKPENIKRLNRITEIGEGNPVLNYVKYFKDLFSPGFLAIPNKNDVKNWQNNYQITWTIDSDNAVLAENIDDEIKTILQQEKEKLVNTIIKLENEIEGKTKGIIEGDVVFVERNRKHRITAIGDSPAIRLAVSRYDVAHVYEKDSY